MPNHTPSQQPLTPGHFSFTFHLKNCTPIHSKNLPRCHQCKAYISPYCRILNPGTMWTCAICKHNNTDIDINSRTDFNYGDSLNHVFNRNMDCELLHFESVVVGARSVQIKPNYVVFVVECTRNSKERGIGCSVIEDIERIFSKNGNLNENLKNLSIAHNNTTNNNNTNTNTNTITKYAFILYNTHIHIITSNSLHTTTDQSHPILQPQDYFFSPKEIINLNLKKYFNFINTTPQDTNNLSGAIQTAYNLLNTISNGIVISFINTVPNYKEGDLTNKESSLKVKNNFYKEMSMKYSLKNICMCFYVLPDKDIELPSLSIMARITGGFIYYLPNYRGMDCKEGKEEGHKDNVQHNEHNSEHSLKDYNLKQHTNQHNEHNQYSNHFSLIYTHLNTFLNKQIGHSAILKIRHPPSLKITDYFGNFHIKNEHNNNEILSFCMIDFDNSITVGCKMNEIEGECSEQIDEIVKRNVNDQLMSCSTHIPFQIACLYTNNQGHRMLRIINFILPYLNTNKKYFNIKEESKYILLKCINEEIQCYGSGQGVLDSMIKERKGLHEQVRERESIDTMNHTVNHTVDHNTIHNTADTMNHTIHNTIPINSDTIHNTMNSSNTIHDTIHNTSISLHNISTSNTYNLSLLKLINALKKSTILRPTIPPPIDYRSFYIHLLLTGNKELTDRIIYPLLIKYDYYNKRMIIINLSREVLDIDGVYIMDAGYNFFFFIGTSVCNDKVSVDIKRSVTECYEVLSKNRNGKDNEVLRIVHSLRRNIKIQPMYHLIRDDIEMNESLSKQLFFSYFYDDEIHNVESYRNMERKYKMVRKD